MPEIDDLVRTQNLIGGVCADKIMSLDEAYERYGGKRPSKLSRMLHALWRVKDA